MTPELLPTIWFALLGVLLTGYAILDGFDLGVGTMHLVLARTDEERRTSLNSIGPLWDGNEVWLVTFGGALFAAFPIAYAATFSGFYSAFMLVLFALIFRAVSIEFRGKMKSSAGKTAWDVAFSGASALAAFLFGVAVGNVFRGVPIDDAGEVRSSLVEQLSPFPLLVGLLTLSLFAMHGTIFLHLKTEGELRRRAGAWMGRTFALFALLFLLTTVATARTVPHAFDNLERYPILWAVPVLNLLAVLNIPRAIHLRRPGYAFVSSSCVIAALVFLLGTTLFPYLLRSSPHPDQSLTIANAASSDTTLRIMLVIAGVGMPAVLAYSAVVYWTFRGKVRLDEHSY